MRLTSTAGDAGKRLDRFLQEQLPAYSRTRLQDWIRGGRVLVEGKAEKPSYPLRGGETVEVEPAELAPLRAEPEALPVEVLYEDEELIAVNKPAGMVVHAGAGCRAGTLVNALLHHYGALSGVAGELRPGIVHRLDRETSGVLLVARTMPLIATWRRSSRSRRGEDLSRHGPRHGEGGPADRQTDHPRPGTAYAHDGETGPGAYGDHRIPCCKAVPGFTYLEVASAPGARTRSVCIWQASVTRSRVTGSTERRPVWRGGRP